MEELLLRLLEELLLRLFLEELLLHKEVFLGRAWKEARGCGTVLLHGPRLRLRTEVLLRGPRLGLRGCGAANLSPSTLTAVILDGRPIMAICLAYHGAAELLVGGCQAPLLLGAAEPPRRRGAAPRRLLVVARVVCWVPRRWIVWQAAVVREHAPCAVGFPAALIRAVLPFLHDSAFDANPRLRSVWPEPVCSGPPTAWVGVPWAPAE